MGNNLLQTAEGSERAAKRLLRSVTSDAAAWPKDFVAGIIDECFVNDNNEIRFKLEQMPIALRSLTAMPEDDARNLIQALTGRVRSGRAVDWWRSRERDEAVKFLDEIDAPGLAPALEALVEALRAVELPSNDLGYE